MLNIGHATGRRGGRRISTPLKTACVSRNFCFLWTTGGKGLSLWLCRPVGNTPEARSESVTAHDESIGRCAKNFRCMKIPATP